MTLAKGMSYQIKDVGSFPYTTNHHPTRLEAIPGTTRGACRLPLFSREGSVGV